MKKIMFNDRYGLTQAVLDGTRTMTRRVIHPKFFSLQWDVEYNQHTLVFETSDGYLVDIRDSAYAPYRVGENVAVAQKYEEIFNSSFHITHLDGNVVKAENLKGWRNKMFVKPDLMPHQIKIIDIRCERLQDIMDEDCMREGVAVEYAPNGRASYYFFDHKRQREVWFDTPREAFAALIDKTCGKGTWARNPWVWVYEFELVK